MRGLTVPVLGGGLGVFGFLKGIFPKLILCKSILDTNRITMQFIKTKKVISTVDEITPQLLEV